jgi:hypothetical protein
MPQPPQDPRQRRQPQGRRPQQQPVQQQPAAPRQGADQQRRKRLNLGKVWDVHLTVGLLDEWVRVPKVDWDMFRDIVVLGRRDVMLRATYEGRETGLVIRGDSDLRYTIQAADAARNLGLMRVISLDALRRETLKADEEKD